MKRLFSNYYSDTPQYWNRDEAKWTDAENATDYYTIKVKDWRRENIPKGAISVRYYTPEEWAVISKKST